MQPKLFVTLQLEVVHHFIERCTGGRSRRLEPPVTLGATKTPKTRFLNPYQLPAHGLLMSLRPQGCLTAYLLLACCQGTQHSPFTVGPVAAQNRPQSRRNGKRVKGQEEFYIRRFGWSVGHPTKMENYFWWARSIFRGPRLKWRNRLSVASGFVRLEAISIAQYQGRIPSFDGEPPQLWI
jgi:hypothetical protein